MTASTNVNTARDAYCVTCGEETKADAQTGRCLRCGKLTMTASTLAGYDSHELRTAQAPPATTRVSLPHSSASQKWIDQTRALESSFKAAAAEAEKKADEISASVETRVAAHKADAIRFRNAAAVLGQLLQQVSVDSAPTSRAAPTGLGRGVRRKAPGEWARSRTGEIFTACAKCGRTDRRHRAKGLCETCYR